MASPRRRRSTSSGLAVALAACAVAVLHGLHVMLRAPEPVAGAAFATSAKQPYAKRPKNAYLFFVADKRVNYMEDGKSMTEVGRELGKAWGKLTPSKRRKYDAMAAKDRQRFDEEVKSGLAVKKRKTKKAAKAGLERPKRPMTAYMFFCNANRPKHARQGMSFGEASKALGAEWRAMTAAAKRSYEKQAAEAKARLEEEVLMS